MDNQVDFKQIIPLDSGIVVHKTTKEREFYEWDKLPNDIEVENPKSNPVRLFIKDEKFSVPKAWAMIDTDDGYIVRREKLNACALPNDKRHEYMSIRRRYQNSRYGGGSNGYKERARHYSSYVSDEDR